MFGAYLRNNFGGKAFVMALWQTGVTWAPTAHLNETNYDGALEHIAKKLGTWAQRIAAAREHHQADPDTKEAQRRSGGNTGVHGLTAEEVDNRFVFKKARSEHYWARGLQPNPSSQRQMAKQWKRLRTREIAPT